MRTRNLQTVTVCRSAVFSKFFPAVYTRLWLILSPRRFSPCLPTLHQPTERAFYTLTYPYAAAFPTSHRVFLSPVHLWCVSRLLVFVFVLFRCLPLLFSPVPIALDAQLTHGV